MIRKDIKHVHLSVHPPSGRVTLVAPAGTRLEVARAYAISKLGWIRNQQAKLLGQAKETPRQFVERESHYLWGIAAGARPAPGRDDQGGTAGHGLEHEGRSSTPEDYSKFRGSAIYAAQDERPRRLTVTALGGGFRPTMLSQWPQARG